MAINSALPMIRAYRARITKVGFCGRPIPGERNQYITDGFIEFGMERETEDGDEITLKNANGQVCASDRTDDQFKRYNVSLQLCGVNPEVMNLMTGNPMTLDANGEVDGWLQQTGASAGGFALELWVGTGGGEDCDVPLDDAVLTQGEDAQDYWYILLPWVKGGVFGDITINGTDAAEITVSGYTGSGAHWGRGPYEVVAGPDGDPARLPADVPAKTHLVSRRTQVTPPPNSNGAVALELPTPYYGVVDALAPKVSTVRVPAGATGGTFTLSFDGKATGPIAYDADAAAVQTAVRALGGGLTAAKVSGSAADGFRVEYTALKPLTGNGSSLEGASSVSVS